MDLLAQLLGFAFFTLVGATALAGLGDALQVLRRDQGRRTSRSPEISTLPS